MDRYKNANTNVYWTQPKLSRDKTNDVHIIHIKTTWTMFVDLKKDSEKILKQVTSPKMYSMLNI